MATNQVILNGDTLIDLTDDTVTSDSLLIGQTAHGANGEIIQGNLGIFTSAIPAGLIFPYAGIIIPNGFLLCDGSEISREEYINLFTALGEIYGKGDGSTTFNLPNLCGRTLLGAGSNSANNSNDFGSLSAGSINRSLGEMGGASSHKHGLGAGHAHVTSSGPNLRFRYRSVPNWEATWAIVGTNSVAQNIQMGDAATLGGTTDNENNMPPYIVVNYIISTGRLNVNHTAIDLIDDDTINALE